MANIVRQRLPCASHAVKGHVGGDVSFERLPKVVGYFFYLFFAMWELGWAVVVA